MSFECVSCKNYVAGVDIDEPQRCAQCGNARIAEIESQLDAKHAQLVAVADKLRALRAAARALVDALPKCDEHPDRPATKAWERGSSRQCDECGDGLKWDWMPTPDYPRAAPLRALVALLGEDK